MRRYVFVSHANPDKPKLRRLIEALLDANIPLWIDRPEEIGLGERQLACGRIRSGADWREEIRRALEGAGCILFLLSRESNSSTRSDELFREFEFGRSRNILVAARIESVDPTELNPFFRITQMLDLTSSGGDLDGSDLPKERFDILVARLREHLVPAGDLNSDSDRSRHRPPRLLPYLTDRHQQQRYLTKVLQTELDRTSKRPVTFIAIGSADDCVDSFVEQVRYMRLPAILELNGLNPDVRYRRICWPTPERHERVSTDYIEHLFDDLKEQICNMLAVKVSANRAVIERKFVSTPGSCLFHVAICLSDWGEPLRALLESWLRWFGSLDLATARYPIVTVLTIEYSAEFFSRILCQRSLGGVRRKVHAMAAEPEFDGVLHILPELGTVRFDDVEQWIRDHVDNVDHEVLRRRMRGQFSGVLGLGQRRRSMYDAAEIVRTALSDPSVRLGM